jgi:hypothetical protein
MENGPQKAVLKPPQKQQKPPSPHIPRFFAVLAIGLLLAIPIAVPIVVMKVTGKSGKKYDTLEAAITGPELSKDFVPIADEEVTKEEQRESFLKVTDKSVSSLAIQRTCRCWGCH